MISLRFDTFRSLKARLRESSGKIADGWTQEINVIRDARGQPGVVFAYTGPNTIKTEADLDQVRDQEVVHAGVFRLPDGRNMLVQSSFNRKR